MKRLLIILILLTSICASVYGQTSKDTKKADKKSFTDEKSLSLYVGISRVPIRDNAVFPALKIGFDYFDKRYGFGLEFLSTNGVSKPYGYDPSAGTYDIFYRQLLFTNYYRIVDIKTE